MFTRRLVPVLALTALLAVPLAADAQDQPAPGSRSRSGFMMSGRLLTPWSPWGSVGLDTLLGGVVALPRFVVGAQIKDLGIGAGLNIFSWDSVFGAGDATMFIFGPTVTYAVAKGAGGRTQLHILGSFSFGMGSSNDNDITALGFDFGVLGRALLLDAFGIDVGIVFDFLSINIDPDEPRADDETDRGIQLVGFLGGTFIL